MLGFHNNKSKQRLIIEHFIITCNRDRIKTRHARVLLTWITN